MTGKRNRTNSRDRRLAVSGGKSGLVLAGGGSAKAGSARSLTP
ncbi:hypothetical protein [Kamptonema formosum]|nr:hypothetical protein [Oscillatoria sp. PCC 10802]